ncbi:MAG: ABC transporter permease [bacterium]
MKDRGYFSIRSFLIHLYQVIRWGAKLGWDLEGNWLPAWGFLLFSLIAPIAGVLMVVFMYRVVSGGALSGEFSCFLLPGMVGFLFIRQILTYSGYVVIEDREHYRLLRYTYIVPFPLGIQVLARVLPRYAISTAGAVVVLGIGGWAMGVRLDLKAVDWGSSIAALVVALVAIQALGWILASLMLLIDRMGWVFAEGISGVLFLASGAAFPLTILPQGLQQLGYILPITYWLDIWRVAFFGTNSLRTFPHIATHQLWTLFLLTTLIWVVIAFLWGQMANRWARRWGRIERETFY